MKGCPLQLLLLQGSALFCLLFASPTTAQIVPDATLPNNSTVRLQETTNIIEGGTTAGGNLFHSFQEFSVPTGGTAFFNNALDIQNIFSRVTGSSISNIDGLINAQGTANLFLLNPNGIIFGPNARLNIGGSFLASTASSFKFADGTEFSAINPQASPLLTINVPVGLQFGSNRGSIVVQGQGLSRNLPIIFGNVESIVESEIEFEQEFFASPIGLQVQPGRTLAFVGGDVTISGGLLKAPSGRIELGSVAGSSLVSLNSTQTGLALGYQGVQNFQDIQLSGQSAVFVSGSGGGDIQIQGRRITQSERSQIRANNLGSEPGGTVTIRGSESVEFVGGAVQGQFPSILTAITFGAGNSGNIAIETERLTIRDGAVVGIATAGDGSGGNLTIRASESVEAIANLADRSFFIPSGLVAVTFGTGNSGNIAIETSRLSVRDGGVIAIGAGDKGNGGTLTVRAEESVEVTGKLPSENLPIPSLLLAATGGEGKSGDVVIETGQLIVRDGGIVGLGTGGKGDGGTLTVRASESIELTGGFTVLDTFIASSLTGGSINTVDASLLPFPIETPSIGDVGDITIETGQLIIRDGAQVSSATNSVGKAGNITVQAQEVELIGRSLDGKSASGLAAGTQGAGNAGNVTIETGRLTLRDGAEVSVSTTSSGDAGNLTVQAQEIKLIGTGASPFAANGQAPSRLFAATFTSGTTTVAATGKAGDVTIDTEHLIVRDGAAIAAGTLGSEGDAGTIVVRAEDSVELVGGSVLVAATDSIFIKAGDETTIYLGAGNAGDVTIETGRLIVQDKAAIVASTTFSKGDAGTITVRASDSVELTGGSSLITTTSFSTGKAGDVTIDTEELTLRDGGVVLAATFFSKGDAGTITIRASESVELSGVAPDGQLSSLTAATQNGGKAGNVVIKTEQLTIRDRAQASVSSSSTQQQPTPEQLAQIPPEQRQLLEQFLDKLEITDIFIQPPADPGSITIEARLLRLDNQGALNATSATGKGGNISLRSRDIQLLSQSEISAAGSPNLPTTEGDITINTNSLVLLENSRIITDAKDPQGGSNISISRLNELGLAVFQSQNSIINASGELTVEREVEPDTPNIPPVEVVDATNQFVSACPTGTRYADNEFFITGRGGIPPGPRELLGNNAIGIDWVTPTSQPQGSRRIGEQRSRRTEERPTPTEITEAQGWVIGANGEVILTAAASTPTPHSSWHRPTDCRLPHSASQR